ncbi:MAG TPA: LPS export ABC transporter periplasmic protein LptC [Pseudomonadales bacterium]
MALRLIRRAAPTDGRGGRYTRAWIMLVLVLAVAVVALVGIDRSAGPAIPPLPSRPLTGEPDIYMESPEVSQFRTDGSLEYRLLAANAQHFQPDARTLLRAPDLTLFRADAPPWSVRADRGTLQRPPGAAEETVLLQGGVVLRATRLNGDPMRLLTERLTLYPRRQFAETDQDVMIQGRFGQTTATGLAADLQLGVIRLFSAEDRPVVTVLEPEQFK